MGSDDLIDGDSLAVGGLHRALDGLGALDLEADDRRGDLFWGGQDGGVLRAAVALGPVGLVVADDEEGAAGGDGLAGASDDAGACRLSEPSARPGIARNEQDKGSNPFPGSNVADQRRPTTCGTPALSSSVASSWPRRRAPSPQTNRGIARDAKTWGQLVMEPEHVPE